MDLIANGVLKKVGAESGFGMEGEGSEGEGDFRSIVDLDKVATMEGAAERDFNFVSSNMVTFLKNMFAAQEWKEKTTKEME